MSNLVALLRLVLLAPENLPELVLLLGVLFDDTLLLEQVFTCKSVKPIGLDRDWQKCSPSITVLQ